MLAITWWVISTYRWRVSGPAISSQMNRLDLLGLFELRILEGPVYNENIEAENQCRNSKKLLQFIFFVSKNKEFTCTQQ